MELQYNIELLIYAIVSCLFLSLYIFGKYKHSYLKKFGIPGPEAYAIVGHLFPLAYKGMVKFDCEMRKKYGKVVGFYVGFQPTILVSDPDIIKQICVSEFSSFINRFNFLPPDEFSENFLNSLKDDRWKYVRSVLSPAFSSKRMKQMSILIDNVVNHLDDNFASIAKSDKESDMKTVFSWYTLDVILTTAFGVEVNSQKNPDHFLVKSFSEFFQTNFQRTFASILVLYRPYWKLLKTLRIPNNYGSTMKRIAAFTKLIVKERRESNIRREDILQSMLDAQAEEVKQDINDGKETHKTGVSDDVLIAQSVLFLLAGHETTATTLAFLSYSLALHPEIQDRLHQEIVSVLGEDMPDYNNIQRLPFLDMCLDETLRMYPSAIRIQREVSNNVQVSGWTFPKDTDISLSVYPLHHDPEYWPEPEKFIPERFSPECKEKIHPYAYIPFGAGPRICLGMKLARLESKLAIARLVKKYEFIKSFKTDEHLNFVSHFFLAAKNGVWLKINQRQL
ncbi:cytochrome P450 3A8 [Octopus bimaculoides]|uniref:Cytochrome P450 n=1 Tax=Octopus bimaculoides TaxID=37653 RepID=A0A0L8I7S1_OCTBM|nr:cytochrome P450 3A8 [Octopus bimaculoides]|eukprot:XP_014788122.1 PREDICTED: cytochrome P450 3A8-like [Octopus bimaculoides]